MSGITEVIDNLYISGLESPTAILNKGIRAVINISSECPLQNLGPNVDYEKIAIPDVPTASIHVYFDRLTDRIERNLQQGIKTLVHCYVGRSRSASIILAYLMRYQNMSLREAFYYLRSRRSIIGPNFGFIKQLINYERSLFGTTSVSFIDTTLGSVPDIYLSMDSNSPRRRVMETSNPMMISSKPLNRTQSSNHRHSLSTRPVSSSWLFNSTSDDHLNSSFLHQPSSRFYASSLRPMESFGESSYRSRMDRLFPRYYFP